MVDAKYICINFVRAKNKQRQEVNDPLHGERANNAWVKNQNLNLVLNLIRESNLVSRADISKKTGLSRSTVSQLVAYLLESGMVEEIGSGESIGGRRPILLQLKPEGRLICAIHVDDGGQIQAVAEDLLGNIVKRSSRVVLEANDLIPALICLINEVMENQVDRIVSIVLALPGIISTEGWILSAVNLGWKSVPVSSEIAKVFPVPILAENATGLAAYGEFDARNLETRNLVYLRIGAAVGAGIVTNNQLHQGLRGSEAEIGHMVIDLNGKVCKCGRRGCLETKVSRAAIFEVVKERMQLEKGSHPVEVANVFEWLIDQDLLAKESAQAILRTIAQYVAVGVINVLNLIGTDAVIIQSKLTESQTFWNTLRETIASEALPFAKGEFELSPSLLGENAILKGATAYGRRYFFEQSRFCIENS